MPEGNPLLINSGFNAQHFTRKPQGGTLDRNADQVVRASAPQRPIKIRPSVYKVYVTEAQGTEEEPLSM